MALTFAAKRGVDVELILPHVPDKKFAFALAKGHYRELLDAGVKIYEYTPGFVHAKVFVSDDCKAVVGTINLDYRSLYLHFENAVYLYDCPCIADIVADFDATRAQSQIVTHFRAAQAGSAAHVNGSLKKGEPVMSKCYLLFAEGLEECEGLITLDILRRAGLETYTVSVEDAHTVVGAHGVPVTCDRTLPELLAAPPELVVLPGGMPGTTNLAKSPAVETLVRRTLEHGGRAAAICAAPSVLAQYGLLAGRRATCYPGFEDRCAGAQMVDADVVTDGQITTGRALGAAIPFALELVRLLTDEQTAARTAEEIVYRA